MKKYFLKLFIFLVPVIIVGGIMELMLRHIPNDFRNKKQFLDANSEQIQVLILGGSHTLYGINPEYLKEKSYNACQVSQTLDFDLALLKKFNGKWSNLQFIVLPVSYASLFEKLEKSIEPWRIKNYCIYYKMRVSNYFPYYSEILSNKLETNFRRLYSYYVLNSGNAFCTELGWDTTFSYNSESRDLVKAGKTAAELHRWADDQYFDEMVLTLESIIIFAESHKSKIILFTPPAFETYREHLDQNQLNRSIAAAGSLANKYDNCFYFNFLEDKSFTEIDFYNADHLNKMGAEKLTLRIDSIIWDIKKR
jgi:hypothetical protein